MKTTLKQNTERILANVRSIMPDGILLSVGKKDYFISFDRLPWFRTATVADIMNVSYDGDEEIRWDSLDVDLELDSLKYPERYPLVMKRYAGEVF